MVSDAYSEIQSLAEEMGEWRDNMEEKLSHTEKFERVRNLTGRASRYDRQPRRQRRISGDVRLMAIRIEISATDRNGHVLETKAVIGHHFGATLGRRKEVYRDMKARHKDHDGVEPYIFTKTLSTDSYTEKR